MASIRETRPPVTVYLGGHWYKAYLVKDDPTYEVDAAYQAKIAREWGPDNAPPLGHYYQIVICMGQNGPHSGFRDVHAKDIHMGLRKGTTVQDLNHAPKKKVVPPPLPRLPKPPPLPKL